MLRETAMIIILKCATSISAKVSAHMRQIVATSILESGAGNATESHDVRKVHSHMSTICVQQLTNK